MPYAPVASGDFAFGHDGVNDTAISASVRINPDTGDGIVVLATGSRNLAPALGFQWVFRQTGLPDFLNIPGEIKRVMLVLLGGAVVIVMVLIVMAWRRRRIRKAKGAH